MIDYGEPWTYDLRIGCAAVYCRDESYAAKCDPISGSAIVMCLSEAHDWALAYAHGTYEEQTGWQMDGRRLTRLERMVACVNALVGVPNPVAVPILIGACQKLVVADAMADICNAVQYVKDALCAAGLEGE